jgi:UDP-N-acetylmuramate--alanine ligase
MIGVGGSGMSGAASLLKDLGARVSGSDLVPFDGMGELVAGGVRISVGHSGALVDDEVKLVVASAAIPETNPELQVARSRSLPVLKYADLLGGLMGLREGVAVAGTHGKSTTSGLTAFLFQRAGLSPAFAIGARSNQLGGNSAVGAGRHFIVESCEFDRSFLRLYPKLATILNVEPDHLDCYRDLGEIVAAFAEFASNVETDGLLVCNGEDDCAVHAARSCRASVETFGFEPGVDWRATNLRVNRGCHAFDVRYRGERFCSTRVSLPGRYMVGNALAAVALAHHAGADAEQIATALPDYLGMDRRLTRRGIWGGITLVDDYAHHPTEIRLTLRAARELYLPRRLWVIFQPHQTIRTRHFMAQFAESFGDAHRIIVTDVYGAREQSFGEESASKQLVDRMVRHGSPGRYIQSIDDVAGAFFDELEPGDLVMTVGAGDVWKIANELVERFCSPDRERRPDCQADVVSPGGSGPIPVPAA